MAKYNVAQRIEKLTGQIEDQVASEMLDEFKRELVKQFKLRKQHIEDWQDLSEQELAKLKNRIEAIAGKNDPLSQNDIKDLGLIAALYWNEIANGQ